MKWTKEKPTKPGWYWMKIYIHAEPEIIKMDAERYVTEAGSVSNFQVEDFTTALFSSEPIQEPTE